MRRNSIWDELRRMQDEINAIFSSDFIGWENSSRPLLASSSPPPVEASMYKEPLCDLFETVDEIVATIELPGVEKKDIDVNITENAIEVKVEKKDEIKDEDKKKGIYRLERTYAGFYRKIQIPENTDTLKVSATHKNGVLEIRIPKKEKKMGKGKRVEVK